MLQVEHPLDDDFLNGKWQKVAISAPMLFFFWLLEDNRLHPCLFLMF